MGNKVGEILPDASRYFKKSNKLRLGTKGLNNKSIGSIKWNIKYGNKHKVKVKHGFGSKVKFKKLQSQDLGLMAKHKVKFKTRKFCKIKLMKWTPERASFQDILFMGNFSQVPKKKLTSLCKYHNLARYYSHYQKQKIRLTSRKIECKAESLSKRSYLRVGEILQQKCMVQDFKYPKWGISPPRIRGGGLINKKTKLENKKGRGQYSPPLNESTKSEHGKRGGISPHHLTTHA